MDGGNVDWGLRAVQVREKFAVVREAFAPVRNRA